MIYSFSGLIIECKMQRLRRFLSLVGGRQTLGLAICYLRFLSLHVSYKLKNLM